MNFWETLYLIKYRSIFGLALCIGLLFSIPVTVALIQRQTRLTTRAEFKPPSASELISQPAPQLIPEIQDIKQFLGKPGDVVEIDGKNFGYFPENSYVMVRDVVISKANFYKWNDKQISFFIPEEAKSGKITIYNGFAKTLSDQDFTIYNLSTKTRVGNINNNLAIENGLEVYKANMIINGQLIEKEYNTSIQPLVLMTNISVKQLSWLVLYTKNQQILPFYINPLDLN